MVGAARPEHNWPQVLGAPACAGLFRCRLDDFRVDEDLGYAPDGHGEHLWLRVEKRNLTSDWVAAQLARCAGIAPRQVSYAGRKDRRAVTRQWYSLQVPGRDDIEPHTWAIDGVRVLQATHSARKIRRGALRGNRFHIVLRGLEGDLDDLARRTASLAQLGVPNYFGEQRFGRGNLRRARQLFRGELRKGVHRSKRGLYLSAARSLLFNRVLARRVADGSWNRLLPGDLAMLDGTHSIFAAEPEDADQCRRCTELDIHPTGPMPGIDGPQPGSGVAALEAEVLAAEAELVTGVQRFRLAGARRALRCRVAEPAMERDGDTVELGFYLTAGSYATVVLKELVNYRQPEVQANEQVSSQGYDG